LKTKPILSQISFAIHCLDILDMNFSRNFENNNPQHMDIPNIVSSSSGDANNTLSISRSNGNSATSSYEGNYQVNISSTNFEIETITSTYTGLMRIYRLLYVADHCPSLRNEAIFASLKYIQDTHLTTLHKQVKT
jgi:hypothetical protein